MKTRSFNEQVKTSDAVLKGLDSGAKKAPALYLIELRSRVVQTRLLKRRPVETASFAPTEPVRDRN